MRERKFLPILLPKLLLLEFKGKSKKENLDRFDKDSQEKYNLIEEKITEWKQQKQNLWFYLLDIIMPTIDLVCENTFYELKYNDLIVNFFENIQDY